VIYDEAGIWQQSKEAWQAVIRIASATRDQRLLDLAQQRLADAEHQLVSTGER
jgi:hypothetical protein